MRRSQKQQAEELVRQMEEAHDQMKKFIEQGSIPAAMKLLEECQNGGITLGTLIENTEGEGHPTVLFLEEYCELAYQIHEDLANNRKTNTNKIYKLIRQKLIKVSNSLKNDVRIRKEVVFFPYKASMWDSLESVYLAAKEDPECDAYCVPIPYYDMNPDQSLGEMHYEGSEYPKEVEVVDWTGYNFEERKPDVIYIHNPYDGCNFVTSVHPRFYSSNLKKYTDTLVYIPYYSTLGGMSEAQSLCPAYIYADYIVIQSPEFRKYFDVNIPDRKFLPLGSPKFDRVIRKCQNSPEPPEEWVEKMAGKKVYFYNTSISGMLADTEVFLKKMNYVFQCFERRKDVCLLWRPHPLLEAAFESMRPQYRQIYETLKKMFLEKNIGILDTTSDITESVALSDAYIGDVGTSVISLFGIVGKPIFVLNNRILDELGEDNWRKKVRVSFEFQERDRFAIIQGKKLYVSRDEQYDYHYYCDLSDNCRVGEYFMALEINGIKYVCPAKKQDILVIQDKAVKGKIELAKEEVEGRTFVYAWKYERFLLLYPLNYPALVRYDTTTGECIYLKNNIDVFVKEKDGQKIIGASYVYQGKLYAASPMDNTVWVLDIESGKIEVIKIPIQSRCGCCELVEYKDNFWMLPYKGKVIVRWNMRTGEAIEYVGIPDEFNCRDRDSGQECEELPFSTMTFNDDYLYLAPQQANMYIRLNINTARFEQWTPPFENIEEMIKTDITRRGSFFLWRNPEEADGWNKIYDKDRQKLYNVNLNTNEWKEIEIRFDIKELGEYAGGFCEHSETLKYGCIENVFNTLGRFLDGKTVGGPFDREKQLMTYKKIAFNTDGSCGRKVYDYVKVHS